MYVLSNLKVVYSKPSIFSVVPTAVHAGQTVVVVLHDVPSDVTATLKVVPVMGDCRTSSVSAEVDFFV